MEKLVVAFCLLLALAGLPPATFDACAEWDIGTKAGSRLCAEVSVESPDWGTWNLRLGGRLLGPREVWQVSMTSDWRPCRA